MKTKVYLIFALFLGVIAAYLLYFFELKNQTKKQQVSNFVGENSDFVPATLVLPTNAPFQSDHLNNAYQVGYEKGYYSFLIQNGQDAEKMTAYTVSVESAFDQENTKDYKDAMEKGYVDGYHKACDSIHCPR